MSNGTNTPTLYSRILLANIGIPYWAVTLVSKRTYSEEAHETRRLETSKAHVPKHVE
jgi:hypothetical protein